MRISFPYDEIAAVEVPDRRLMAVVGPADGVPPAPAERLVRHALEHPLQCPTLRDLARRAKRVLILFDDNTRPTPAWQIAPHLVAELQAGGNQPDIAFMTASGTHRPMTDLEKEAKLGAEICGSFPVFDHRWSDPTELVDLGQTDSGIPVQVNRMLLRHDIVIGIGHVAPHRQAGFGGGGKIVQPGVSGAATTGRTHWASAAFTGQELLGVADNPIRAEMERVAAMAGLTCVVNVVLSARNEMVGCFFGSPGRVYHSAAELSRRVFAGHVPALADIVVIESYPADIEMWQATKALAAAELVVRPGGRIILVTPSPEGVSRSHPAVLEFGYQPYKVVREWVERGEMTDLLVAAELAICGRIIRERAGGILVSPGITPEQARALGFEPAASVQDALDLATRALGSDANILVVRHGGEILPIIA